MKELLHKRREHHQTRHGLHPVLPIFLAFVGTIVVSVVFGMLIFPAFTQICADELFGAIAVIGYYGVGIVFIALMLEAYNLYEHHKKHVALVVFITFLMCGMITYLIKMISMAFTCI
ncbi:MAG: hypothetical protein Q8P90_03690 [bacterium]|nr:hypothetical protein [bacterium]